MPLMRKAKSTARTGEVCLLPCLLAEVVVVVVVVVRLQ